MKAKTYIALAAVAALLPLSAFAQGVGVSGSVSGSVQAPAGTGDAGVTARVRMGVRANATTSAARAEVRAQAVANRIAEAKQRADSEIDRRIGNMTALQARIEAMAKIASSSATLEQSLQAQIAAMTALKAKVGSDDATTSLRADIQSITKSYRIYALVIPQAALTASADRILAVADQLAAFSAKLGQRISPLSSDTSAMMQGLASMNAKIADARVQANAAVSAIVSLQADNGVTSVRDANASALKGAREKLQTAQQDLVAARKDAGSIVKMLEALSPSASASGSAAATSTVH